MPAATLPGAPPCPLLIGTQNPALGGGVLTLVRAFIRWARQEPGLAPALAYGPAHWSDPSNAGPLSFLRGQCRPRIRQETWQGLPAACVGRFLPALESLHGLGSKRLWQQMLGPVQLHQVICGYAVTGVPQALSGKPFVAWVATSMDGDKRARLRHFDPLRRIAHSLQYPALERLERLVLKRAAWVFALSPHTQEELLQRGAVPGRTTVLPCPVDTDQFTPAQRPPSRPTILWAGRHDDPRKNTALLLRAFARIAPSLPEARLVLPGEAHPDNLPRLAAQMGLARRVDFLGHRPDVDLPSIYRQASVFVIPSDQEGLCIAGLEAMACGLPVVSTRCGGPEAFVQHEQTGLLVARDGETELADALYHLLTADEVRHRLGRQARALVEGDYSFAAFARHIRRVYTRVWPGLFPSEQPDKGDTVLSPLGTSQR
jgi:glycosyltransferase involved in cell wall biosynthesis